MDYKGDPFGSMPKLLAISNDVKKCMQFVLTVVKLPTTPLE